MTELTASWAKDEGEKHGDPDAFEAKTHSGQGGARPGAGRPTRHGYRAMRRSLATLTTRRLDGRSAVAVAVRRWKDDVRRDLGEDLSRAQETILEGAAQKWLITSSLADYVARQGSLVSKRRTVAPVVLQYLQVVDSLERSLERLGLERRTKEVADLRSYLAEREDGSVG